MAEHDLCAVAFPRLDDGQIATLGRCAGASLRRYRAGQTLFQAGARDFKFFVVKSGEVEIQAPTTDEPPRTIAVLGPGEFTGDVAHLTGSPSVVSAVARSTSEVHEVQPETLRQVLNRCPDLGDVILQALIARRQLLRESGNFTGLRVIGSRYSRETFRIRDFLARNRVLFTWLDLETDPEVDRLLQRFGVSRADTPVVACGQRLLRNPSNRELAEAAGIRRPPEQMTYDLAVVGAGPAGLAAAVYGASEGLKTVVLERTAPGGQAATSMRIENYPGFPTGVTGAELADRAVIQAYKFGAQLSIPTPVTALTFETVYPVLRLETGETVAARCLLIATGADYRRLTAEGCERFEGAGVYYAATYNEAQICRGSDVVVVGGGNSAGQAAVFLAGHTRRVFLVVRGDDLYKSMSAYLARRIEETDSIERMLDTEVVRMLGDTHLAAIETMNTRTRAQRTLETPAVFSFIGAVPRTDWLPKETEVDSKGFILTGPATARVGSWAGPRDPFLLETSRPGVFAAGDVRAGSIKRVTSAVGEGAMAVQFVHEYLKAM